MRREPSVPIRGSGTRLEHSKGKGYFKHQTASPRSVSRLLLVDDDAALLHALSEALHLRLGHFTLDICKSGTEALECIRARPYDTIISDFTMPDLNGLQLMRQLKQVRADVPVVLISGHADEPWIAQALEAGASDFIAKPFERNVFMEAVRGTLHVARLRCLWDCQEAALNRGQDRYIKSMERLTQRTEGRLVAGARCPASLDVLGVEEVIRQQQADQQLKTFTHTMTGHLAKLDHFLFRTTEAHRETAAQLNTAQERVRSRAWMRLGKTPPCGFQAHP